MEPTQSSEHHVAIISPYARTVVSFRGSLIRELIGCGCRVSVLAPDFTPQIRAEVAQLGAAPVDYPLDRTGLHPFRDLFTLWSLWKILRDIHPTIVLAYNIKPNIYGALAGWAARCPSRIAWITGLGHYFTETRVGGLRKTVLQGLIQTLYRFALKTCNTVCFQNSDDKAEMVQRRLVSSSKAVVVGASGVDLCEWLPAPPILEPITFTLAARLLREKGIVEFAEAAQRIKHRYPNTRFLLLGGMDTNPGALREHEVRQWAEAGILEWHGHVPDVRPYFAQTSVYVLPSYREGVPRSTQEAMAMARPVITTDAPGCRETVVDGVNGFLVPPRDVDALVRAMERFILQPDLIIQMGQASRKLAEERFDVHKINQRILAVMGIAGSGTEFPKMNSDVETSASVPQAGI
jgi:glycosyltransferase involved in cell wall biosynthesis